MQLSPQYIIRDCLLLLDHAPKILSVFSDLQLYRLIILVMTK